MGSLILSGSTLYGMTCWWRRPGNGVSDGTVFSIPVGGGTPTVLFSFDGTHGADPQGSLTLSGSTLYGMTVYGGNMSLNGGYGDGTVFALHALPGDANSDGRVDINDLTIVLTNFGQTGHDLEPGRLHRRRHGRHQRPDDRAEQLRLRRHCRRPRPPSPSPPPSPCSPSPSSPRWSTPAAGQ